MKKFLGILFIFSFMVFISGCVPTITKQPTSVTVPSGQTATFGVEAKVSGSGSLNYQWQRKDAGSGKTFINIAGATTATYTTAKVSYIADNSAQFKCVVTSGSDKVESNTATLNIDTFITGNPSSCVVADGADASFSVETDGSGCTYKWFRAEPGSNDFLAISANANQSNYTFKADYSNDSGAMFRCEVSFNGLTKTTTAAVLTVSPNPIVIQTDLDESNTVANGATKKFEVVVSSGTSVKYQWCRAEASDNSNFQPIAGATGNSYTLNADYETDNGARFLCRLHNVVGDIESKKADLNVTVENIAISSQPVNQSLPNGQTATFTIGVSGYKPSYRWTITYLSDPAEEVLTSGNILNIADISYAKYNGAKVKCTVANVAGSATSDEATLTVIPVLYVNCLVVGGNNNGSSWPNAFNNLQLALDKVRFDNSIKEIWVATGTYKPTADDDQSISFNMVEGVAIYGGFSGNETSREARNYSTNVTTLSGDLGITLLPDGSNKDIAIDDNTYHVVIGADNAALDGFVITGGCAVKEASLWAGSGMYNINCSPTVMNCTFNWNKAWLLGGGMYNNQKSNPIVKNCIFSENTSYNGSGMSNSDSNPIVTDCTFSHNIENCGAIYNSESSPIISNCIFIGNRAYNNGGAIFSTTNSNPMITSCIFSGNIADFYGGAICNVMSTNTVVLNCTFNGNTAAYGGGGIFNGHSSNPTITNCILSGNDSGGIYNLDNSNPKVTNCTINGNIFNEGSAIYNNTNSNPVVTNCIIWGNTSNGKDFVNQICNNDSTPEFSFCDIQMATGKIYTGTGNINSDPLFLRNPDVLADPKDFGDLRLQIGSPCIDTGSNTALPDGTLFDIIGLPRIIGGIIDMGANEFQDGSVLR